MTCGETQRLRTAGPPKEPARTPPTGAELRLRGPCTLGLTPPLLSNAVLGQTPVPLGETASHGARRARRADSGSLLPKHGPGTCDFAEDKIPPSTQRACPPHLREARCAGGAGGGTSTSSPPREDVTRPSPGQIQSGGDTPRDMMAATGEREAVAASGERGPGRKDRLLPSSPLCNQDVLNGCAR